MQGRLPDTSSLAVAKHPKFDEGQKQAEENEEKHKLLAKQLKPRGLTKDETKVWDRVALELSKNNRLKSLYVDVIHQYCVVKVRMDGLRGELDKDDWYYVTMGRHGEQWKSRPGVAQLNDDFRKFMQLTAHLGLSPATELRFNAKQGDLFENEFDGL
ncbi:P27 family phage terminase small subunit [Pleionea sediminis]|uniref:P27 family phage terminase small subunit n=1 Tax=Pleionea sediminis TaxID=2569479 RepID=UPI0011865602|nr:P27 family phage terminase small subunit [Pleionea sediminis]